MSDDAKAWGEFWANNSGGDANGCLPERWAAIEDAQRQAWLGFVGDLPEGAAILDLATGDGRVLHWIYEARSDMALTGIDLAPELPPAPTGTETRGGVAMEDLPFAADSFTGVVSQFGFEYGDVAKIAAEIARVLRSGGKVGLMVHRGDGPILEHNRSRMAAIQWVLGEVDIVTAMTKALDAPGAGPQVAAQVGEAVARLGASKFGPTSPAWEIPEALKRACLLDRQQGDAATRETFAAIAAQAQNEIGRIESLARACATADDRESLVAAFTSLGFTHDGTRPVEEPSGRALADFLVFSLPD